MVNARKQLPIHVACLNTGDVDPASLEVLEDPARNAARPDARSLHGPLSLALALALALSTWLRTRGASYV